MPRPRPCSCMFCRIVRRLTSSQITASHGLALVKKLFALEHVLFLLMSMSFVAGFILSEFLHTIANAGGAFI